MADERELAGCVLLNNYTYDLEEFRVQFNDDWKVEIENDPNPFNYMFDLGEARVTMQVVPMKKAEAVDAAQMNLEWAEAAETVAEHKGQVQIMVTGEGVPLQRYVLFSMIVSSMMKQENVIGLYQYPKVWRAQDYIDIAEVMKREDIPTNLWIYVGVHQDDEGLWNCYTYGMENFGKEEMEILHTKTDPWDMYRFMNELVKWLIVSDKDLTPGEKIGASADQMWEITRSEAAVYDGTSLKIGYKV